MFHRVRDHENLVRDMNSKAILNTDRKGLEDYRMRLEIAKREQKEQLETKNRLEKIEQEMSDIKILLKELVTLRSKDGN